METAISWVMPFQYLCVSAVWFGAIGVQAGCVPCVRVQLRKWGVLCGALTDVSFTLGRQNQALWLVTSLGSFLLRWHPGQRSQQQQAG